MPIIRCKGHYYLHVQGIVLKCFSDCDRFSHVFSIKAKSHGFPHRNQHAHTDAHHLRPTDRSVNTSRGNRDFDEGGTPHAECLACRVDADSWEPPDGVKGDAARMLLYLAVRYEGEDGDTPDLELLNRATSGSEPFLDLREHLNRELRF